MSISSAPNTPLLIPTPTPTCTITDPSAPNQRKDDAPFSSGVHAAFTVNNIRNSIPILLSCDCDYGQYLSWVELFRIHANVYNLLHHIEANAPRPSTVDEPTWKLLDAIVKQWIYATISQDLLQAIMKPGASAKELWARLKKNFKERRDIYVRELQSNFYNTKLKDFSSVVLYCQRLEELSNKLSNSGQPVFEGLMVNTLISGLPKGKYNSIVTKYRQHDLSYIEARSDLLSEEAIRPTSPKLTAEEVSHNKLIYKAALRNDWNSVSGIFHNKQELITKPVTWKLETPLMIAVGTNRSHDFVQRLLEKLQSEDLDAENLEGNTALHYAAKVGNLIDAKRLVDRRDDLTSCVNNEGKEAVMLAASLGRKDMLLYLLGVTELYHSEIRDLIPLTIQAGLIDVALLLLHPYRHQRLEFNGEAGVLDVLAKKPELFRSGSSLGFLGNLIYDSLIHVNKSKIKSKLLGENPTESDEEDPNESDEENPAFDDEKTTDDTYRLSPALEKITVRATGIWRVLQYIAPPIKNIYDIKIKHVQTNLIVEDMCSRIPLNFDQANASEIYESTIANTIKYGACELVEQCISTMAYDLEESSLFHLAIQHRHVKVYNLVIQTTSHKAFVASYVDEEKRENALHIVAKLAPPDRINTITGAALQMQREFQWYKEIESFLGSSDKEALNIDNKTPRMIFTDEHKGLLKEGQEWMKEASTSCTVVGALIITITFAAIFTVPGGNKDDDGKPMFLNNRVFMLFIISDAIGLFSSSTSVLMFLGILTSRYAEDDFLYALPRRITIGLVALFLSLAATLVTFSATLALVVQEKVTWIAAPLAIMTSIPVCLFILLQFPLLVELVNSTYGPSIFCKHSKRKID